jgi:hypothetical protein
VHDTLNQSKLFPLTTDINNNNNNNNNSDENFESLPSNNLLNKINNNEKSKYESNRSLSNLKVTFSNQDIQYSKEFGSDDKDDTNYKVKKTVKLNSPTLDRRRNNNKKRNNSEEATKNVNNKIVDTPDINNHSPEYDDFLKSNEITKIESFYSSVGCFVYVSRCVAELYEVKRGEDEFDAMDTDPVNEYRIFMENKRKMEEESKN